VKQSYADVRVERGNQSFIIHTRRGSVLAQTLRNTVMGRYSPSHEAMIVPARFERTLVKIMTNHAERQAEQIKAITRPHRDQNQSPRQVPSAVINILNHLRTA
jgi:hypothetical protein